MMMLWGDDGIDSPPTYTYTNRHTRKLPQSHRSEALVLLVLLLLLLLLLRLDEDDAGCDDGPMHIDVPPTYTYPPNHTHTPHFNPTHTNMY